MEPRRVAGAPSIRWIVKGIVAAAIVASFGAPKAECADGPTGTRVGAALVAIASTTFCPTAGQVAPVGARGLRVTTSGMRGVIAGDLSRSVEIAFVFRGASKDAVPLANGEMRQQIGLKLRAKDTCNVIYVMWHIAPDKGVHVAVKSNPGLVTHAECSDHGYINLESKVSVAAPEIRANQAHTLRADIDGTSLRVHADGVEVWRGALPDEAFAFDGPAGARSDNGKFDFELRIPGGGKPAARCVDSGTESAH
jgi:hypothetical protein